MIYSVATSSPAPPLEDRLSRAREFSSGFLNWARGRGDAVILVHENPDPDCLATALALRHLLKVQADVNASIAFSGMIGRSENLNMATLLEIPLVPVEIVDFSEYEIICLVDTQPGTGNNALPSGITPDIVIDHHPPRPNTESVLWADIRPEYGVTATILYEYLLANEVSIDDRLTTAIFYAIKSDTQDLGRDADVPDSEAYLSLFKTVDMQLLYRITNPRQPVEYFRTVKKAIEGCRRYGSAVTVNLEQVVYPELVAEMADFILKLEGVNTVLSFGQYANDLILSVRTCRADDNAGIIVKKLVKGAGCGGGHNFMGGGKISLTDLDMESATLQVVGRLLQILTLTDSIPKTVDE